VYENLVFDTNNLFWRASHKAFSEYLTTKDNQKIYKRIVEEFLDRIKFCEEKYGGGNPFVYFIFDNPTSKITEREQINPEYKHVRKSRHVPDNFYPTLKLMAQILSHYSDRYRIIWAEKKEADDLTLPVKNLIVPTVHNRILYISNDMDWARNIDAVSHWYDWKTLYNHENFFAVWKFHPTAESVIMYKSLLGDKSDQIHKAVRLNEEQAVELINRWGTLTDLYTNLSALEAPVRQDLLTNRPKVMMNYRLVSFLPFEGNLNEDIQMGKRNTTWLRVWYNSLKIPLEEWMRPMDSVEDFLSPKKIRSKK
jgi:5'-3' exonuclease